MEARMTDDPAEFAHIVQLLVADVVSPADRELFLESVPAYITQSPPFRFFLVSDGPPNDAVAAAGLLTMMEAPWIEEVVAAVDGLWLREESAAVVELVLHHLLTFTERLDFAALCIGERSTNRPEFLGSLLPQGLASNRILLQAFLTGVYSAFTEGPLESSAFFADVAALSTIAPDVDISGAE